MGSGAGSAGAARARRTRLERCGLSRGVARRRIRRPASRIEARPGANLVSGVEAGTPSPMFFRDALLQFDRRYQSVAAAEGRELAIGESTRIHVCIVEAAGENNRPAPVGASQEGPSFKLKGQLSRPTSRNAASLERIASAPKKSLLPSHSAGASAPPRAVRSASTSG